jgi:hypothetical protein
VRELPGWAEFEARMAGVTPPEAKKPEPAAAPPPSPPKPSVKAAPETPRVTDKPAAPEKPPVSEKPSATEPAAVRDEPVVGEAGEALRFSAAPFTPAGFAYDAVSGRFIVGDRESRKLSVVGERSHNATNLASAATAGFQELAALAIDAREGDLWVASSANGSASVHKLQLISGRVFFAVQSPKGTDARLADLVVTPQSTVVALDDLGRRLFRIKPGSKEMEVGWVIEAAEPVSVAAPSDSVAYVAHREGLARIDLIASHERAVRARDGIELTGLAWIRSYRSGLIAVQRTSQGMFRIVRIALDASGTRATSLTLLDKDVAMASPAAASITGDTLYYLSTPDGAASTSVVVKRVRLK